MKDKGLFLQYPHLNFKIYDRNRQITLIFGILTYFSLKSKEIGMQESALKSSISPA